MRPRGGAATTRRCTARARQTDWHWHRGSRRQWSSLVTESVSRITAVCAFREHASRVSFKLLRGPSARCYVPFCRSSIAVVRRNQERTIERIEFDRLTLRSAVLSVWILWKQRETRSRSVSRPGNIAERPTNKRTNEYVVYIVAFINLSEYTRTKWSKRKKEENTDTK